ncbi:hypothetical protein F511_22196 [Dorcoceras hygrometricum]|uniref:Uncharacterized protein n=1 Tax=Dorcoceras hygrometricum TaxID=472368 RepID=A0A2Z7CH08_9LAMI|nr:hypothetical protein F511_22196 [Dorcoceras hygrometricum]
MGIPVPEPISTGMEMGILELFGGEDGFPGYSAGRGGESAGDAPRYWCCCRGIPRAIVVTRFEILLVWDSLYLPYLQLLLQLDLL